MNTQIKTIKGYTYDGEVFTQKRVIVRVTSDKTGETLSLQAGEYLIGVSLEDVEKVAQKARNK